MNNSFNLPVQTLGDNKYLYGAYCEMAFHNFYITLEHIYKTVLKKELKDDTIRFGRSQYGSNFNESLLKDFSNKMLWDTASHNLRNAKPEEKVKARELIGYHFPFIIPMVEAKRRADARRSNRVHPNDNQIETSTATEEIIPDDYFNYSYSILQGLSIVMRQMRNEFSHYRLCPEQGQIAQFASNERYVIYELKSVYDGARRIVKKRFMYTDSEMACSDRFEMVSDPNSRDSRGRQRRAPRERNDFPYRIDVMGNDEPHFSVFGVMMFFSLFLEKRYIHLLTDKVRCIIPDDRKIIEEIMACYRMRLPIKKLNSKKNSTALGLDMLNEMRKCPKELFELLDAEHQNKFRVNAGDVDEDTDSVLLLRHSDRFAYFAMRYIDTMKLLDQCHDEEGKLIKMRFQVALGKYFYKFYNKICIDSNSANRVRSLQKDLNGFGCLEEIEDARKETWENLIREYEDVHQNTAEEKPYITDHHASYMMNANRIGIAVMPENKDYLLPEINEDGARCLAPTCWLSTYDLPAMILLHTLNKQKPAQIIFDYINSYRKLFTDIYEGTLIPVSTDTDLELVLKNNYGLRLKDVPQKLQDYLLSKESDASAKFNKSAQNYIEKLIEESEYRLDKIEEQEKLVKNPKQNKVGSKRFVIIKPGRIADFLAHDIMMFMPCDDTKLTGLNFAVLQATLATYHEGNVMQLNKVLQSAKIIRHDDYQLGHPFLWAAMNDNPRNTIELYKSYLRERINYLRTKAMKANPASLSFLHPDRMKWRKRDEEYYKNLAARYLKDEYQGTEFSKSIELPRGLFDNSLRLELARSGNPMLLQQAIDDNNNMAFLIKSYFSIIKDDASQPFYNYSRNYAIFDSETPYRKLTEHTFLTPAEMMAKEKVYNTTFIDSLVSKTELTFAEKRKRVRLEDKKAELKSKLSSQIKTFKKTQKAIRRYAVQDMVVWLMMQNLLFEDTRNVGSEGKLGKLQELKLSSVTDKNILNEKIDFHVDVELELGNRHTVTKTISQADMKLKDYSQFYRILSDRRMKSLLTLILDRYVDKNDILEEFARFDNVHPEILRIVFEVEKDYIDSTGTTDHFNFWDALRNTTELTEREIGLLQGIRNSFAHMFYAGGVEGVKDTHLPNKAERIRDEFRKKINK